ncbi:short-chain dehydrogenase/reductase family 16C member 6-like [Oppia nitens]|uniref:short-chain dehydrogenase/reductase family 16C member 6-like n=1 Tax=Oppia nitens TaxID=1686743 RepID=UPI0023DA0607|nr:short-chain dehydrogenase/reductase family 16C member 6-like [Oppia nitens]
MNSMLQIVYDISLLLYYWLEGIVLFFVPKRLRYKSVTDDIVLITGGGSGLGRLLALRFARRGARVVVWDINKQGLDETLRLIDGEKHVGVTADNNDIKIKSAYSYVCDVSDRAQVYETAKQVRESVGKVTILVNNAGIVSGKRFLETPDDHILRTFHVNAISHFWTIKAFLPDMMTSTRNGNNNNNKGYGHLVSVASVAGLSGTVRLTDYCASKFAAVGLDESLRLELQCDGYTGIKSTVVCPYFINTGMFDGVSSSIIPILEPTYVADEIMSAILTNQEVLVIPKLFYTLLSLKSLLPTKASFITLNNTFGFTKTMTEFKGHSK